MIKRGDDWMKRRLRLVSVFISCLLAFSSVGFLLNDNSVLAYSEDTKSGFGEQSLDEYDFDSETVSGDSIDPFYNTGDDYPAKYKNADRGSITDEWLFFNRECTSFVAWCLNSRNGVNFTNYYGGVRWSNASNWKNAAQSVGITVDSTPAVGSVGWSGGHVVWVKAISGSDVAIEEYNVSSDGAFHSRTVPANTMEYIHIKDIDDSPFPRKDVVSGVYAIHTAWDDQFCMDIAGDSKESNANIQLYQVLRNEVQKFRIIKYGEYYYIQSVYSGLWLDAARPIKNNSNVKLYFTNTDPEQSWYFEDAGDGYVYIKNKMGYYLDVQGDEAKNNANLQLYQYVGNNSQKWRLEDVTDYVTAPSGDCVIHSAWDDNFCLDITGDSQENNANIQLYQRVKTNNVQTFNFVKDGNYYNVQSVYNRLWLDVKLPFADNANVKLYYKNDALENEWILENAGNGYVYIRNHSGFYLDVQGDEATNNANIQIYHFVGNKSQKWRIEDLTQFNKIKNFAGKALSYKEAELSWDSVSGVDGYAVYRTKPSPEEFVLVKETTDTTFTDSNLTGEETYLYRIQAYRKVGERVYYGDMSDIISVTLPKKATPTPTNTPTPVPEEPVVTPVPGEPTVTPVPGDPTVTPIPSDPTVTPIPGDPTVTPIPGEPTATPVPDEPVVTPVPGDPTVTPVPGDPTVTPIPGDPTVTPVPGAPTGTPIPGEPSVTPVPEPKDPTFEDFVERLYVVALDRASEPEGKAFWVEKVQNGEYNGADCARFFLLEAPEFMNRKLDNSDFLEILYHTFYDRESDVNGKAYWMGRLDGGTLRRDVVNDFIESTEWCNICATYGVKSGAKYHKAEFASKNAINFATRLYTCCLGRDAEEGGLKYWSLALTNLEQTCCSAAREFFNSAEFKNLNTTPEEYVRRLYTTFMNRNAEDGEVTYWARKIRNGEMSRHAVLQFFGQSEEFTNICAKYGIDRGTI